MGRRGALCSRNFKPNRYRFVVLCVLLVNIWKSESILVETMGHQIISSALADGWAGSTVWQELFWTKLKKILKFIYIFWEGFKILTLVRGHSLTTWTRWGGRESKKSVFVHAQGITTVHAGGGGGGMLNSVHVVVECPRSNSLQTNNVAILLWELNLKFTSSTTAWKLSAYTLVDQNPL